MVLDPTILTGLSALAQRQAGHIARWQLLGLGCTIAQVDRLAQRMGWTDVHAGVWRLAGVTPSPEGLLWAAVLAAMSGAQRGTPRLRPDPVPWEQLHQRACKAIGASAFSGAWLYDLVDNPPTTPQLLIPHDLQRRVPGIRTIRTRVWPDTIALIRGVPTMEVVRCLWDCAWLLRREPDAIAPMRRMMAKADGLRLCSAPELHLVAREPRLFELPGIVPEPFRAAAFSLAGGHSHSAIEHRGRQIITEIAASMGLHVEPRPYELRNERGPVAEADVAIPLIRLDCEIDGPHHDDHDQQRKDRWRDGQVRRLRWTVRRYRTAMIRDDEDAFRELVAADIRQAAAEAGVQLLAA